MRMRWPRLPLALSMCLVLGCSADKGGTDSAGGLDETGMMGDDDTGSDSGEDDPGWWSFSADLEVVKGAVDPAQSRIEVSLIDSDLVSQCTSAATPTAVELQKEVPEGAEDWVYYWFAVAVETWDGECDDVGLVFPDLGALHLGIGVLHPDIEAVLDTLEAAADGSEATLNGAYVSFDEGGNVWVFGPAGTAEAYLAKGEPAEADGVLADGTWMLRPIYLFSEEARP